MKWLMAALLALLVHVPSEAQTDFYLDPDFTGSVKDGSPARPWSVLGSTQWSSINSALASNDVTVYFSARDAAADTDDVSDAEIDIRDKTQNSHRVTFKGNGKYNTNDASPNWQSYSGASKARVSDFLSQNGTQTKLNKVTIDGFRVRMTLSYSAITICGDDWVVRNSDIFHVAGVNNGPLVLLVPTSDGVNGGTDWWCPRSSNITIENNTIHDSQGELLYIGGAGCRAEDNSGQSNCDGFPSHFNILIQNNDIYRGGVHGAQGDGIDLKAGLSNVTIRNNTIRDLTDPANDGGVRAIVISGVRTSDPDQNVLIDGNLIYNVKAEDAAIALVDGWGTPKGIEVRNNVISNLTHGGGIKVYRGTNHKVYNNTVYKAVIEGIVVVTGTTSVINNLLVANNGGGIQTSLSGTITSTNNAFSNTFGASCTNCVSGLAATAFANAAANNFRLVSGSTAIDRGATLSTFSTDKDGGSRPQGTGWDIGAYEFASGGPGPINQPPAVNAGTDQTITLPSVASLVGSASDDGLPSGSALTVAWSQISGPGIAAFGAPTTATTTVAFSATGVYVLRLTASDGALAASDDITVTANPAPVNQAPAVAITNRTDGGTFTGNVPSFTVQALDGNGVASVALYIGGNLVAAIYSSVTALPASNALAWRTTGIPVGGVYQIRAEACDTLGACGSVTITMTRQ